MVAFGATFGNRCSEVYSVEREWKDCVERLAGGGLLLIPEKMVP